MGILLEGDVVDHRKQPDREEQGHHGREHEQVNDGSSRPGQLRVDMDSVEY